MGRKRYGTKEKIVGYWGEKGRKIKPRIQKP
jgi:hypothetical protein